MIKENIVFGGNMFEKFYPGMTVDSVHHIDLAGLKEKKIRGLLLDIDNTLVPNHVADADQKTVEWLERVKNEGFKACIVSNASHKRVVRFNEKLKVYAIHRAGKPGTKAFLKAASLMDLKPEEVAVVGDQIFTDIYGANRAKILSILVKPIDRKEMIFVRLKRYPEKIILKQYKNWLLKNK